MGDTIDMDTTPCHICGHQHFDLAVAEIFQRTQTFVLRNLTGHQCSLDTIFAQAICQRTGFMAAVAKHNGTFDAVDTQIVTQQLIFFIAGNQKHLLRHIVGGFIL